MYLSYKILDKGLVEQYTGAFYQYYIKILYGNKIVTAESVLEEEENE